MAQQRSNSPHSSRRTPQISPIVQWAARASRIGGSRLPVPSGRLADARERRRGGVRVPLGADAGGAFALAALAFGVDPVQLDRRLRLGRELVDADDHPLARLDRLLPAVGGDLDLALHEAALDRGDRAAGLEHLARSARSRAGRARRSAPRCSRSRRADRRSRSCPPRAGGSAACAARSSRHARSAAPAPRRRSSCAATGRRRRPRPAPARRPGRCCSRAAARSASSRPSARGSAAPAPSGSSRRTGRA